MTDTELRRLLLGMLDALIMIPRDRRDELRKTCRGAKTQDEFRLGLLLEAVSVKETDFLKPKLPDNVIPLREY